MVSFQQVLAYRNELLVASDKYRIVRRIGGGSFGDIYLGINTINGEILLAFVSFIPITFTEFLVEGY